jgi:hypothetical protein
VGLLTNYVSVLYDRNNINKSLLVYSETVKHAVEKSLLQSFKFHISSIEKLEGTQFAHNTVRKYKSVLNSITRFLSGKDINLRDLDYSFVSNYYEYLVTKEGLQSNSALKNLKCLYRVIHITRVIVYIAARGCPLTIKDSGFIDQIIITSTCSYCCKCRFTSHICP